MKVIADVHDAVLTKPWSSVMCPVSASSLDMSSPDGPSVASRTGSVSSPLACSSLNSVMQPPYDPCRPPIEETCPAHDLHHQGKRGHAPPCRCTCQGAHRDSAAVHPVDRPFRTA